MEAAHITDGTVLGEFDWHHLDDMHLDPVTGELVATMQLVKKTLHQEAGHSGSFAMFQAYARDFGLDYK